MAHRYFLSCINGSVAAVAREEADHLIKVMRVKEGDSLILTDKSGYDYTAVIKSIKDKEIICDILDKKPNPAQPKKRLTVFMALPKSDKLEFITQKACELGAEALVPFVSSFCVAQKSKKEDSKISRLQKISDQACKQCGRSIPMQVKNTLTFKQMLEEIGGFDKVLFFYENSGERLADAQLDSRENVAVIIGSEGGFSPREALRITDKGAVSVGLGARILRCETAAVTATALTMFLMGEME